MLRLALDPPAFIYANYNGIDYYIFGYIPPSKTDYECMTCGKHGDTSDGTAYFTQINHTVINNFSIGFIFCSKECGDRFNELIHPVFSSFVDTVINVIKCGMEIKIVLGGGSGGLQLLPVVAAAKMAAMDSDTPDADRPAANPETDRAARDV